MRSWFPFTDYDFFGYLSCGVLGLAYADFLLTNGSIVNRPSWSLSQAILLFALSYVVGHVIASLSSAILENWFARTVLRPPISILMNLEAPRKRERLASFLIGGRTYSQAPESFRAKVLQRVRSTLGLEDSSKVSHDEIFQACFAAARTNEDARRRMDDFRNQYGFCRNVSFVALAASVAFIGRAVQIESKLDFAVGVGSFVVGFILLVRFLKFYSQFATEVVRNSIGADKK